MMHYKVIILIIASKGGVYDQYLEIWDKYMNTHPDIKSFFVFGGRSSEDPLPTIGGERSSEDQSTKYPAASIVAPFKESRIPGILQKTMYALEYVNNHYSYDLLFRTNLSSFVILDRLLNTTFPTTKCYHAVPVAYVKGQPGRAYRNQGIPFGSGSGFVLSKDVVDLLLNFKDSLQYSLIDDVAIGLLLYQNNIRLTFAPRYDITKYAHKNLALKKCIEGVNNTLHYHVRVKNRDVKSRATKSGLAELDIYIYQQLYHNFYGKTAQIISNDII